MNPCRLRLAKVFPTLTKVQGDHLLRQVAEGWPNAERISLMMDNLNTHTPGALYEAFPACQAKQLLERRVCKYTKTRQLVEYGGIELQLLSKQCFNRRIATIEEVERESAAWEHSRNKSSKSINWQFTTDDARIKLHSLYPTFEH